MNTSFSIDPEEVLPQVKDMIYKLSWKFSNSYPISFEEALSEAYFGFIKACRDYNPERKTKFSTWCYFSIWTTLKDLVMKRSAQPLVFVEPDDAVLVNVIQEGHPVQELIHELSRDAQELIILLSDTPKEIILGACDLIYGAQPSRRTKRALKFLAEHGKSLLDLIALKEEIIEDDRALSLPN